MKSVLHFVSTPKFKKFVTVYWFPIMGFFSFSTLALWFGFTFLADAIYFNDPNHKDDELKGWMTPRYIQLSYDLPRELVLETLGLPAQLDSMRRMKDVAKNNGLTLEELTTEIRKVAADYRDSQTSGSQTSGSQTSDSQTSDSQTGALK